MGFSFFFFFGGGGVCVFIIYLKIEKAHSSFHKGDQANGLCQQPSFQVVLKPVNKLNTQRQSHAQLINKTHCSRAHNTNPQSCQNQVICPCCVTEPCLVLLCSHLFSTLFAVTRILFQIDLTESAWWHRLVVRLTTFTGTHAAKFCWSIINIAFLEREKPNQKSGWYYSEFKMGWQEKKKNSGRIFYVQYISLKIHCGVR